MVATNDIFDGYLDALLAGDRAGCKKNVNFLREQNLPIMDLYENVFKRSLYEVGELWEYNKISVAVEHLATSITEGLMNELFTENIGKNRKSKKVVVACVEKEDHQVGGRMVSDVFEKNGWDTLFLGANTPTNELIEFCELTQPDVISLSLTVYTNVSILLNEIKAIQALLDSPIFIGGQALQHKGVEIAGRFENVHYFSNLYDIENYLKRRT